MCDLQKSITILQTRIRQPISMRSSFKTHPGRENTQSHAPMASYKPNTGTAPQTPLGASLSQPKIFFKLTIERPQESSLASTESFRGRNVQNDLWLPNSGRACVPLNQFLYRDKHGLQHVHLCQPRYDTFHGRVCAQLQCYHSAFASWGFHNPEV